MKRFRVQATNSLILLVVLLVSAANVSAEAVIYSFTGMAGDGSYPQAELVFDKAGTAYGTTTAGGAFGQGTVFKLDPPVTKGGAWTETVLYSFQGASDGAVPFAGVILDASGSVYGATVGGGTGICFYQNITGCGVVYKLMPGTNGNPWTQSVLYTFTGGADGGDPLATLVFGKSGELYGTTVLGGTVGAGTVFLLRPAGGGTWKESVIHNFGSNDDGGQPVAGLVFDKFGNLWGTTAAGGQFGFGTVFTLHHSPGKQWKEKVLHSFTNGPDGGGPVSRLIFDSSGNVYSTTANGGNANSGTVFTLTNQGGGWVENVLYTFTGSVDGGDPLGGVVFDNAGNLYGTTRGGGRPNYGTVFKLTPPGTQGGSWILSTLYSFTAFTDGGLPYAGLVFGPKGFLYGTTYVGGAPFTFVGTVFRVKP